MSRRQISIRVLGTAFLLLGSAIQAPAITPEEAVSAWIAGSAHPLSSIEPGSAPDDLAPLGEMVGNARLVLLGESRHDAREHFLLKHRVIEYLVAEKGFTVLAMEESMPCAGRINDWLLGGPGDPAELVDAMSAWFIWSTEEVLVLIRWLRRWNDDPAHADKLQFHGLDVMDPLPAVEDLAGYLAAVDPAAAAQLKKIPLEQFSELMWPESSRNYRALSEARLTSIGDGFAALQARMVERRDEYIAGSSASEYEWQLRLALNMKQSHEFFKTGVNSGFLETGHVRERAMTDNALWLLDDHLRGEKVIIWAHNLHIGRDSFDLAIPNRPPTEGMVPVGCRLGEKLGDDMVAIGFSFARGSLRDEPLPAAAPDTVDGVLAAAALAHCFIDLRAAPQGLVGDWLSARQSMRAEGGMAYLAPARAFDLLMFTDELTRTRPTAGATERFRASR